jgi:hypothetical protein
VPEKPFDINRIRAEIEAEAETRRRQDPELARLERDIERAWVDVAPPGAAGDDPGELLLDRADRLALIDVDAPIGERRGVREVKGAIRKATYWYLRYVTDQMNAFSGVLTRLLRRMNERLDHVEHVVGIYRDDRDLLDPPDAPSSATSATIAQEMGPGRTVVLSCGNGEVVAALDEVGGTAYGVDRDAVALLPGVERGLDLRTGDPQAHLVELETGSIDGLVLAGFVETLPVSMLVDLIDTALDRLAAGGRVVVAVADPGNRSPIESELRHGRGISPETWAYLLERRGAVISLVDSPGPRVTRLVIATMP